MRQFDISGMSCAACSTRVEKAVSSLSGVSSCSVNLLTNSMSVEGTASSQDIIKAVENAGYGAAEKGAKADKKENDNTEEKNILKRLIASIVLLLPLMYIGMGHMMFKAPLPAHLEGNHMAQALAQMVLSGAVLIINQKFFISGAKGVLHRSPNMDTLVALGSGISFLWSVYILFKMTGAENAKTLMDSLYFESAAMILTLITVGKMLEARSKGKTTNAIKSLTDLSPKTAHVLREDKETDTPIEDMAQGDIFLVKPGESIPADGVVLEGESAVSEAALTGESIPVDKAVGDSVSAATINTSGFLKCKATRIGEDTTLSQIIKMVTDASATKAPVAKIADKVAGVFVPVVIGIAAVTFVAWLLFGETVAYALKRAISVLVISCPCSLGLATPVAIMVGSGVGAKNGILFKTAEALEATGRIKVAALDKTGTVTEGAPHLTDIVSVSNDNELLKAAVSLERKSEHPLSVAITKYAKENGISADEVTDFKALPGNGLSAKLGEKTLFGGNLKFLADKADIPADMIKRGEELAEEGKTPLYFAQSDKFLGIIAVADTVKDDSAEAIAQLRKLGIKTVLLTGDNRRTAKAIGAKVCADEIFADVLPGEKEEVIRRLQQSGKTLMVGDGINDAPALTRADIGIAIGAGTDVAIDAADVVLMKNTLSDAVAAVNLSRATMRNIKQNLFWAFVYNLLGIPLAAGVFKNSLGLDISPMFGAAAMSLSSVCVVLNALRLNFAKIYMDKKDENKTEVNMEYTITINIKGMMCPHCEATVRGALEAFPEVIKADVSHERGTAEITLKDGNADIEKMKEAVREKGYEVV